MSSIVYPVHKAVTELNYAYPMISYGNHRFPGKLFVVEGTDGSGKSTQLTLLYQWLKAEGYPVFFSEWNSSPLVKDTTRRAKKRHLFTPATFSLLHATDFADRMERNIIPPLKAGAIVLADRYIYTAFARDVARGCDREWVRKVYSFAVKPTLAFFFRAPLEVAIDRIVSARPNLKYYEAGLDMGWSDDPEESFTTFQAKILEEYDQMVDEFGLTTIDATRSIEQQQRETRRLLARHLRRRRSKSD
jgi:dTMP kinase